MGKYDQLASFIRSKFGIQKGFIPLHEPRFCGNERKYVMEAIDSTFVSSVGEYVSRFEEMIVSFTGAKFAIATVNGTAALHVSLVLSDVKPEDEVITQALTFVATANAISYTGAKPVFLDVDLDTMGLSPKAVQEFLDLCCEMKNGYCYNISTGRKVSACVPMHTFGHPCRVDEIVSICKKHNITVIEDAAESLGSFYKGKHTGTFGDFGVISFNGNKIITTGGGGMVITDNELLAKKAKDITTTAKTPHKWEFIHHAFGYNYRLTNLAAAMGCAQIEQLPIFTKNKRNLAHEYYSFFKELKMNFFTEPPDCQSNYWLNAVILENHEKRNDFLEYMDKKKIMARPIWQLMNKLKMYEECQTDKLRNAEWLANRVVNIPSSVRL